MTAPAIKMEGMGMAKNWYGYNQNPFDGPCWPETSDDDAPDWMDLEDDAYHQRVDRELENAE